ncbi:hypothetical protein [Aeromonas hydrophila]|uniref:hypothetical protein n=1 Tax=Aeromonas hydrophila TaxID=644 RepID=UPI0038CF63FB
MAIISVFDSEHIGNLKMRPTNEYPRILQGLKSIAYKNSIVGEYSQLKMLGSYSSINTGFERELLWSCNLLNIHARALNAYLEKRSRYEEFILNKNHDAALSILDEIEAHHGYSFWLIEAKTALLQNKDGLDAQKNFISYLYDTRGSGNEFDLVYYISFLISQRNEPLLKTQSLVDIIKRQLQVDNQPNDALKQFWIFIRYIILGEDISDDIEASILMAYLQTISIYDLFDYVVLCFMGMSFDKKKQSSKNFKLYLRLLSVINDYRIDNVASFDMNKEPLHSSVLVDSNDYLKNAVSEKDKFFFELACYSEKTNNTNIDSSLISDFCVKIRDVFKANESMQESIEWIKKTQLNNKHIRFVSAMHEVISIMQNRKKISVKEKYIATLASHKSIINFVNRDEFNYINGIALVNESEHAFINDLNTFLNDIYFNCEQFKNHPSQILNSNLLPKKIFYYQFMINKLLVKHEYSQAFKLAVDAYLENNNYLPFLPINEMVINRKWSFYSSLENHADAAIIIALYLKSYDDEKQRFNMKACCKRFIDGLDIDFHSELDENSFCGDKFRLIEFLANICIPQTLELDTNRYSNARSVLEQRIKVCEKITTIIKNDKIETELKEIKRKIAVSDGLKTTDTRGVTVDYNGFCSVAEQKIRDNFNRYIAFIEAGIDVGLNYKIKESIGLTYNPIEESDLIIIGIWNELAQIFLSHHEYGLDYYLSMRIRHGRFIGILRGPLEQRKLITKYSSESGCYVENLYWHDIYRASISSDEMTKLQEELASFSLKFDSMIKEFIGSFIQIRSDKKPHGMYHLLISSSLLDLAKNSIKEYKNFDVFLKDTFEIFFLIVESCSKELQKKINSDLKIGIRGLIIELQQKISTIHSLKSIGRFDVNIHDELNHVRTDIDGAISNITNWFETSTYEKQDIRLYTFDELIDIGLARTKQTRTLFDPAIESTLDTNSLEKMRFIPSVVATFSDIFSILFDNVYDHSGMGNEAEIHINAQVLDTNEKNLYFFLNVRNKSIVTTEKTEIINKIKRDIKSHNIRSRQEGHSGYHKLCAISIIKDTDDLDFGFDGEDFYTTMILTLDIDYQDDNGEFDS